MKKKEPNQRLPNMFVATIDPELGRQMLKDLKEQGFTITSPAYTVFSAKKPGVSCTLYQSGKLTVQGKEIQSFIEFYLEPQILKTFAYTYKESTLDLASRIGIDESGKGDFFGPLCIAGVFAEGDTIAKLSQIGVRDSKTLSEAAIVKIASKIRENCTYQIVKINPLKYNELIVKFGNLNYLLAWGHATAIEHLTEKTGCTRIIIDQFANEQVVLTALKRKKLNLEVLQKHRGEEDLVVAAASILARDAFVKGLEEMKKKFDQDFPKGASQKTIAAAKKFIQSHGRESLNQVAKMHFKTLDSILGET